MNTLRLTVLGGEFAVHRLGAGGAIPDEVLRSRPVWVARTDDELSVVCDSRVAVPAERSDDGWSCLRVEGPLDLGLVGVLANLSAALADAGVSLLAQSTFDTDYLLVRSGDLARAIDALTAAGHTVAPPRGA